MKASDIVARATSLIGIHEDPKGSNRGKEIDAWARSAGVPLGSPWCALFVCWGVMKQFEDAVATHVPGAWFLTGGKVFVPSARAVQLFEKNAHLWVPEGELPQPGDIYVMDHGKRKGHTGIVAEVGHVSLDFRFSADVDGRPPWRPAFRDISGNSNASGAREGDCVCQNTRRLDDPRLMGFVRCWSEP